MGRGRVPRRTQKWIVVRVLGRDGRLVGGVNVDIWDVNEHVQVLIRSRSPVDRAALTDLDTLLDSLVGEPTLGG